MSEKQNYDEAVKAIKTAILQSQYDAARTVNEKQLMLYYGIGRYISLNSRNGFWGKGAIDAISEQLDKELPGLRGFTSRNLRYMRTFYEEWEMLDSVRQPKKLAENVSENLELTNSKTEQTVIKSIWNLQVPNYQNFPIDAFLHIGFTHHRVILGKIKNLEERLFYIKRCADEHFTVEELKGSLVADDYHHQGSLPNNFVRTLPAGQQALKAIGTFKDEYLLDYINVEELDAREKTDIDEKVVENAIIHNVKNFILTFGKDFAFIRNQYHLDAFGEDQYIDLLFFNRELNCLVAVELKKGKFKTSYLGQLQGYLSVLDGFERKPHENPAIGIILCKDMNKSFVDYVIQDYTKPMGVATYKTSRDMSEELRKALPSIEDLKKLLDTEEDVAF
ncbi:MAG: PDDEXK nuclease domain-containing protein [Lachnoclostridium sp.]|nr:PDDEXK nuclease domain-containing protein [Lachnospira sp.]MCM1247136.1 PDDEXK nuclease domain-containing protein [Lachnoclostridium sp.]